MLTKDIEIAFLRRNTVGSMTLSGESTTRSITNTIKTARYLLVRIKNLPDSQTNNNNVFRVAMNQNQDPIIHKVHVRLNNENYPTQPLTITPTTKDYNELYRNYKNMCELFGNPPQLEYVDFALNHPIFCFDLSAHQEDLFNTGVNINIHIEKTQGDVTGYCLLMEEAKHLIKISDRRMIRIDNYRDISAAVKAANAKKAADAKTAEERKHNLAMEKEHEISAVKNIPAVFGVDHVDWTAIEKEERRRKDSAKLDVHGYVNAVQSSLGMTQSDVKNSPKQKKSSLIEIMETDAAAKPTINDTRHIILLGKSGIGKSSLGNYLLGAKKFKTNIMEERRTKECHIELTDHMVVMDTPGFFSTLRSDVDVAKEIMNTIKVNRLLTNVYILVLSADERFSGDEKESLEFIKKLFGENVINHMIIVFTGKDSLEDEEFQFPRCLPQLPYFILDCKDRKQEVVEEIRTKICSEKYNNIPAVFDVDHVDWTAIEEEERRRKDSAKLDVHGYVNAVQSSLGMTQSDVKSTPKQKKSFFKRLF
ncbi:hypothetical protein LOTGIDRAFT_153644 [Lottia gigantea]|uniref:AIG1-type G domain-containing protein n=1 Tax=Lottia gigantea TaxID=225164 RepID=V4A3B3_LOTGI|nr:hypothetical protein LOTGIDRAFT_153644 [Lottia gigantea]ESO91212.1 hypothetical protein LOTGIDRAFT_153644 [Lottia gigantea]